MTHGTMLLPAEPGVGKITAGGTRNQTAAPVGEAEQLPLWTPARIDLARRLWIKGAAESEIVSALNNLPGAPHQDGQALTALAERLCWPSPRRPPLPRRLRSRDGAPSVSELEAGAMPDALDMVELPMEDAVAWGRANGVVRQPGESDAALLVRINRARLYWRLPRFRPSRPLPPRRDEPVPEEGFSLGLRLLRPARRGRPPAERVRR
jgi:hypothetical protein